MACGFEVSSFLDNKIGRINRSVQPSCGMDFHSFDSVDVAFNLSLDDDDPDVYVRFDFSVFSDDQESIVVS